MSPNRRGGLRLWIPIALLLALVIAVVLRVMEASSVDAPAPTIDQIRAERGIPVRLATAQRGTLEVWRSFSGTLSGVQEGVVRARSGDQVAAVPVSLGSRVTRGQVLVRLSGEGAEARMRQAEVAARQARRTVERLEPLFGAGALSEQEWEQATNQLELAEADLAAVGEALALTSPLDGVVTELQARPGLVPETGEPLVRVADLSRLVIRLQVSAPEASELQEGDPARVPGAEVTGRVRRIALQADPLTRLVEVEVEFPGDRSLIAGTLQTVEVRVAEREDVVHVPAEAISDGGVWVVTDGAVVARRQVEAGVQGDGVVEIESGLSEGDRVVVEGGSLLGEGSRVRDVNGTAGEN